MTILLLFQKYIREILLFLFILLGFSLGQLAATLLGLSINQPAGIQPVKVVAPEKSDALPPLASFKPILQRNLLNAQIGDLDAFGIQENKPQQDAPTHSSNTKFTLLGTVSGEPKAMAIMQAGRESDSYVVGATLPGGARLVEVQRNQVVIENNGRRETLKVDLDAPAPPSTDRPTKIRERNTAKQKPANNSGIREIGENRWLIPAEEADRARNNINDLLRQARVEPNIVDGQTDGFAVRMIRPGSLFSMLGLQVGDVLHDVNGVKLDTPEKALQVFQQLREARQISISLERQGTPQTFAYEIN